MKYSKYKAKLSEDTNPSQHVADRAKITTLLPAKGNAVSPVGILYETNESNDKKAGISKFIIDRVKDKDAEKRHCLSVHGKIMVVAVAAFILF